jgi:hypothetical protein
LTRPSLEEEQDNEHDWHQPEHRYGDVIPKVIVHWGNVLEECDRHLISARMAMSILPLGDSKLQYDAQAHAGYKSQPGERKNKQPAIPRHTEKRAAANQEGV